MIGKDAEMDWSSRDAYHIAVYRKYDLPIDILEEELVEDFTLFEKPSKEDIEDEGIVLEPSPEFLKAFRESNAKSLELTEEEVKEIDTIIDNLVEYWKHQ